MLEIHASFRVAAPKLLRSLLDKAGKSSKVKKAALKTDGLGSVTELRPRLGCAVPYPYSSWLLGLPIVALLTTTDGFHLYHHWLTGCLVGLNAYSSDNTSRHALVGFGAFVAWWLWCEQATGFPRCLYHGICGGI